MKEKLRVQEQLSSLRHELVESRAECRASSERANNLAEQMEVSTKLASEVVLNMHVVGERLASCCTYLGDLLYVVNSTTRGVSRAVEYSRQV